MKHHRPLNEPLDVGRSTLIGKDGVWVGIGWGHHPIHGDEGASGFMCISVVGTHDTWVICVSGSLAPSEEVEEAKKRALALLGTPAIGAKFAHLAARGIARARGNQGLSFEELKKMLVSTTPAEEWHWWDPGEKP